MSTVLSEVLTANQKYSESFGEKANLALPPARRFAVLTCMDARLDPAKYAGLSVSELKRLKTLEDENRRLKQIVADQALDNWALKELLAKNF